MAISILHFPARSYVSWINHLHGNHKTPLSGANRDRYFGQEPLESDMVIQGVTSMVQPSKLGIG